MMAEEFDLSGKLGTVTLTSDTEGSPITLNTITPELAEDGDTYLWQGDYFIEYPVTVTANAPGFSHWEVTVGEDTKTYTESTLEVPIEEGGVRIHAVFQ